MIDLMSKVYTAVVVEYFKSPITTTSKLADVVQKYADLKMTISSPQKLLNMPRGAILGKYIDMPDFADLQIFYPFFSHLKMPIKPGEQIFVLNNGKIGYWMSRKVSDVIAEDPNYTHNDRSIFSSTSISTTQTSPGTKVPANEFPDLGNTLSYKKIVENSDAIKEDFQGESVPRHNSLSTDFVMQGSNNTIIVMGSAATIGEKQKDAAFVGITAGRGSTPATAPTTKIQNSRNYEETNKAVAANENEGALDPINDKSTIILTMKIDPDVLMNSNIGNITGEGASIIEKSDKIRIIARNDIKITVGDDPNAAGIIIKNGDIILIPSPTGVIKLGSEDASGAILASPAAINVGGIITAPPLVDTNGGTMGVPGVPATGVFSSKVLVKV